MFLIVFVSWCGVVASERGSTRFQLLVVVCEFVGVLGVFWIIHVCFQRTSPQAFSGEFLLFPVLFLHGCITQGS